MFLRNLFLSIGIAIIIGITYLYFASNRPKPNVILITIDALRQDHLGCYGYQKGTSPNIDKLAREGTLFTQAVSAATWTPPSLCSILTSRYPGVFGLFDVSRDWGDMAAGSIDNLPGILQKNGYQTCLVSSHYGLNKLIGLRRNFNKFNCWVKGRDENITSSAIDWLKKSHDKPFFLWLHYMGPHLPYEPPSPYDSLFLEEDSGKHTHISAQTDKVTNASYYISQYDAEIAFTDEQIGALSEYLKRTGIHKKTTIILTADHGESLTEHGLYFDHGGDLYDTLIKVPLILVSDGIIPKNKKVGGQVSLVDIMPTVLDILKLRTKNEIDGLSLLPLISGRDSSSGRCVFAERFFNKKRQVAVRSVEYKMIFYLADRKYKFYNLKEDPREENNLFSEKRPEALHLKEELRNYLARVRPAVDKKTNNLDEETEEYLKSLGYLK